MHSSIMRHSASLGACAAAACCLLLPSAASAQVPAPPMGMAKRPMSKSMKKDMKEVIFKFKLLTGSAVQVLKRVGDLQREKKDPAIYAPAEHKLLMTWFSTAKEEDVETLWNNYGKILQAAPETDQFVDHRLAYDPDDGSSRASAQGEGQPWWFVVLSPEYFKHQTGDGYWSQEGILLHELSHIALHSADSLKAGDTFDKKQRLAVKDRVQGKPQAGLIEADCYAFFAEGARELYSRR